MASLFKLLLFLLIGLLSISDAEGKFTSIEDLRADPSLYNIGIAIHDATGPVAGVNMMGYANPAQINNGIHIRLYSRAFIVDDGLNRLVFVSVDCGMMGQIIKMEVISKLQEDFGDSYDFDNVILSGTHTHSGPAGFQQYLLYDITSLGFIHDTYDAMVEGIYQSIVKAHNNMKSGYIMASFGELVDASINRSPTAYQNNPEEEKARYQYDTDKIMTLLKFVADDGADLGMINWFAVHPTSMNNTNKLVSGDNKGYASQLFENEMNHGSLPGEGSFVAAFAQTNCGDVSPNTDGAKCQDTGLPCDIQHSSCGGKAKMCYALGPGKDMIESTKIIGEKQFNKAWELYNDGVTTLISGPIQFSQMFTDMANYTVTLEDGNTTETCPPALGYSFAAGTTDGPGAFDFTQGTTEENPFWNMIVDFIHETSPEQEECQAPKPVLLDTGHFNRPYPWHPRIMETIVGRIGQLLILSVPGEFTTMSGRRLRETISAKAESLGLVSPIPVISGLSNVYSHYITTNEEYAIQRYEGASTIFGPHTLRAYVQQFEEHIQALSDNVTLPSGPFPPNLLDQQISLLPGVIFDTPPIGSYFGDVIAHPYPIAYTGETIIAKFISGHPRNNVQLGSTFLTVSKLVNGTSWEVVATDASWETRFTWFQTSRFFGTSEITVYWDVPEGTPVGTYMIHHYGQYRDALSEETFPYEGITNSFMIDTSPLQQKSRQIFWSYPISGPFYWIKKLFM